MPDSQKGSFNVLILPDALKMALAYITAIALIPLYVNLFSLWKLVNTHTSESFMLAAPFLLAGAGILTLFFSGGKKQNRSELRIKWIVSGLLFCLLAMFSANPAFPIKRIHVAEYLLLSLLVRYGMSFHLQSLDLLVFSFLFSATLGVHDEVLQGFHQARTYGLRDISTNLMSCLGGSFLFHGFKLFEREEVTTSCESWLPEAYYLLYLVLSLMALMIPLQFLKGIDALPLWLGLPLSSTIALYFLHKTRFCTTRIHGLTAFSLVAWLFILYPLYGYVEKIPFY